MAGGPGNPMGARALYLGTTVYRIHGTNQPQTIGSAVSSGCFRLVNADVIDLYERIPVGTKVIVRSDRNCNADRAAAAIVMSERGAAMRKLVRAGTFRSGLLIGVRDRGRGRGRRHHLRALRHADPEAHGQPRAQCFAASTPACRASRCTTTRATGRASMSISAAPSRRRSSMIRARSSSFRSTPTSASPKLQNRKVDVLSRNSTWSMSRETDYAPAFRGGVLLRRPGLHAAQVAQHRFRP